MRMEIQKRMEEEIKKLVEEKPDDAVKLIRNWLSEE
jgi:flagellar biosynthesis/type III secretory pathway M-ring protein FliF/YscJ